MASRSAHKLHSVLPRWFFPGLRQSVGATPFFIRWPLNLAGWGMLLGVIAVIVLNLVYSSLAQRYSLESLGKMPERSEVYDARGNIIGRLHGENRTVVPLSEVSPFFLKALLAREDSRFYDHGGVDWLGVLRAMARLAKDPDVRQGASTITMQLARNSYNLTREKSVNRKFMEIAITRRIEANRTKEQILELYVNRIFFGTGIFGIERASQSYFGKSAKNMTPDEGAMLAAIIRGPNKFSPFRHYDIAMSGRDMVLDRMVTVGAISAAEADRIKQVKTRVLPEPAATRDTWALDAVRRDLEKLLDENDVDEGGLKIFTTIEPALQTAAEAALEKQLASVEKVPGYKHETRAQYQNLVDRKLAVEPEYLQGAVVLLENATGAIRAIVGGRDIQHSSFNRAQLSRRTVGSAFKPFVYAAAVEYAGLLPGKLINDAAIQPGEIQSAEGEFSPRNSDGTFNGYEPAWWGMAKSRNTMAVRVGEMAGMEAVKALADRAGLKGIDGRSAQIYLGNLGATLESLASATSVFGNGGQRCRPFLIDRIENSEGQLVFRSGVVSYEVVSPGTAWLMTALMRKVMEPGGTASSVRELGYKTAAAGKTGTTDDYHDAWFTGYTSRLACGVWVGLDDPGRIIHQGYGSRLALPVWASVMMAAEKLGYKPAEGWPQPGEIRRVIVCSLSGKLAGRGCGAYATEMDLPVDHIPGQHCEIHAGNGFPAEVQHPAETPEQPSRPGFFQRLGGLFR